MTHEERIAELEAENTVLQERVRERSLLREQVARVTTQVEDLHARLAKDSHHSSKPPSSDGLSRKTKSLRRRNAEPRADTLTVSWLKHGRFFSLLPRSFCCESTKGLPSPLDIARRIFVAVQDESTGGADMGPYRETLLHSFPTATAVVSGIGGRYCYDSTASICCFAFEDQTEAGPPGILNRLVEAGFGAGNSSGRRVLQTYHERLNQEERLAAISRGKTCYVSVRVASVS